ncbi:MAG: HAMP domain-containing histidine kinase [Actinomycetales bacterium]|nr:HAMP domain-containing histidine kinase [Actinomycetales bacterium]
MRIDWRVWLERLARSWRGSLQLRVVAITLVLSGVAVTVTGVFISASVRTNLFETRRDQVVKEAGLATERAQERFTQAFEVGQSQDISVVQQAATNAIQSTVSTGPLIKIARVPGQDGPGLLEPQESFGFSDVRLSDELQTAVQEGDPGAISWQSIAVPAADGGTAPGLAIGSLLDVPEAGGLYQLYFVYDLSEVQQALGFVQRTLVLGGLALVLAIGVVAFVVAQIVVGPVRRAAETSEKLAAGRLEERLRERGDDELATLARSFNRMADSMQTQIGQLATLSRLQQRFVSDVSHELRTPLTTIRLAGEVLYDQREDFAPATARTAELLRTQIDRFEVLLADLLEMSRFDAGAVELEREPTNLVRLAEDAIDAVRPLADEHGSELRLVAPGGYCEAEVDPRRIRRILQNLLGNAIDHGEGRPIAVYVDSDATAVAMAVRDHGMGMSAEQVERVFDRFWRADPSRQRRSGGTGLGLAISMEDAVLHGGELDLWSKPGEGSCFRLTIPREAGIEVLGSPLDLPPEDPPVEREPAS